MEGSGESHGPPSVEAGAMLRELEARSRLLEEANAALAQREATLRENEERLRLAVQAANIGHWEWDLETDLLTDSPWGREQLGYSEGELGPTLRDWEDLVHPDDLSTSLRRLREQVGRLNTLEAEFRMRHKDGAYRWLFVRGEVLRNSLGQPQRVVGCHLDVTRRKEAEQALRESQRRLAAIAATMPEALYVFDVQQGVTTYANREVWRDLGYSLQQIEEMGPKFMYHLTHPEDLERMPGLLERWNTALDGEVLEVEYRLRDAAGNWRWFLGRDSVYERDATGRVRCIVGTTKEVTERKAAEVALRQSEEKYRDLVETSHNLIWSVDQAGRWTFVNEQGARRIYGCDAAEMLGRPFTDFLTPEQSAKDLDVFAAIKAGRPVFDYETEHLRPDGRTVPLSFNAIPILSPDGEILGTTGSAVDLTARRQAEADRLNLELQLQQAQKLESLGVLAGGIAHDFNNLLTGVLGYANLALLELPEGSDSRRWIEKSMEAARRAADVTQQMLAYSGKGHFEVVTTDLSTLAEEMTRLLEISISKQCRLRYELCRDLPKVEADAGQIRQVVLNLIINASEAVGDRPGEIIVRTGVYRDDRDLCRQTLFGDDLQPGEFVFLEVRDTGNGMSEETRQRIFDPFFSTRGAGRGLGLAAVLGIVRGHRGAIGCDSSPGQGTCFRVYFPASERSAAPEVPPNPAQELWKGSGVALVVEDEESVREMAAAMLERLGFSVETARNGLEALNLVQAETRIALVDLTMPYLDGRQTAERLHEFCPDLPVILTSGFSENPASMDGGESGAPVFAGFLPKPYQFEQMMAVVRKALGV